LRDAHILEGDFRRVGGADTQFALDFVPGDAPGIGRDNDQAEAVVL
jgi:hypothetical protein